LLIAILTTIIYCGDFEGAVPGRALYFPNDHGKHPGFETEWWYFTGNLASKDHNWGTQLTFFKRSLFKEFDGDRSAWAVRDLFPAHFAITNITDKIFFHTELMSREGPGLAGAAADHLNVYVKDWSASQKGEKIFLRAGSGDYSINLALTPEKPIALHGNRGFSVKGNDPEQASYYYSFTRLKATGSLLFNGVSHDVSGLMWMDHEFGSSILNSEQVGWDWFSLQFDNGTELMAFQLRRKDGSFEKPFATLVDSSGKTTNLSGESIIIIRATKTWMSPRTKAIYPCEWIIEIPEEKLQIKITPTVGDQELSASKSTQTSYWEGAVTASGSLDGQQIEGRGYVELTGYAESMGGRL
jgi:predicted secreted hydrolase